MTLSRSTLRATGILACAAITAGGCSSIVDPDPGQLLDADTIEARLDAGITFIRMKIDPEESMDALFEGSVDVDNDGCIRLESEEGHTVVWPKAYDFDSSGGTVRILNAAGEVVGRMGEDFSLAGGEVTTLHDGLGFTESDRVLAEARCPGRYWIAALD